MNLDPNVHVKQLCSKNARPNPVSSLYAMYVAAQTLAKCFLPGHHSI